MSGAPDDLVASLSAHWQSRWPALTTVGADLIDRYGEPTRRYHDRRHLADVLRHVDDLAEHAADSTAVELAAWFHDAVYDARRTDNERASAELARRALTESLPPPLVEEVIRLVLVTEDHVVPPGDRNAAVLCDADLAILAAPPATYDDYVARVRAEYRHVSDDAFRVGRAAVLRQLLGLPALFSTDIARERWERSARANLGRELAALS